MHIPKYKYSLFFLYPPSFCFCFCFPGEELLHSSLQHSDHKDLWSEEGEGRALEKEQVSCFSLSPLCSTSSSLLSCASVQNEMLAFEWDAQVSGYQSCMSKEGTKVTIISAEKVLSNKQMWPSFNSMY